MWWILGVIGSVASIVALALAFMDRRRGTGGAVESEKAPNNAQRRRAFRILVIDDQLFPHVKELKKEGFNVERVADLKSWQKIENYVYELIMVDIHGVGANLSLDSGLDLLLELKKRHPSQIALVYSAQNWSFAENRQLEIADGRLDRGDPYSEFRAAVEEQLSRLTDPEFFVETPALIEDAEAMSYVEQLLLRGTSVEMPKKLAACSAADRLAEGRLAHAKEVARKLELDRIRHR